MKELVAILAPFDEASEFAQVESHPSAGYVLPCIRGLQHHLNSIVTRYHSGFINELKQFLSKRMAIYNTKVDYMIASALDSRFKLMWCRDGDEKNHVKDMMKDELELAVAEIIAESPADSQDDGDISKTNAAGTEEPQSKRRKTLFRFMDNVREKQKMGCEDSNYNYNTQLKKYLEEEECEHDKSNPLNFWKENETSYPLQAKLASKVLGILFCSCRTVVQCSRKGVQT